MCGNDYISLVIYRKLFTEAEEEQTKMGSASGLHIIIFDEIDAICKERGTVVSSVYQVYKNVKSYTKLKCHTLSTT